MPKPLRIRIVATDGPGRTFESHRDVRVGIQVRKEVLDIHPGDSRRIVWEVDATLDDAGVVRGPAIHGGRGERFLYLDWLDGAQGFRRAKLQLDAVPPGLLARATKTALVGTLSLTDAKGGPVCASVRPPAIAWTVA